MPRYVILLRAVNVGGKILKMEDFHSTLAGLGMKAVRTYIQSGNALVEWDRARPEEVADEVTAALTAATGAPLPAIVKSEGEILEIAESHPLERGDNAKALYVTFPASLPEAAASEGLAKLASGPERFQVRSGVVYGFYPAGYGTSKFSNAFLERKLGRTCTTRNWATVRALARLLDA